MGSLFPPAQSRHTSASTIYKRGRWSKLQTGVQWLSSLAIHPGGDNVIVGSYDRRLAWFDLDLSTRPYKTLRYHSFALRQVREPNGHNYDERKNPFFLCPLYFMLCARGCRSVSTPPTRCLLLAATTALSTLCMGWYITICCRTLSSLPVKVCVCVCSLSLSLFLSFFLSLSLLLSFFLSLSVRCLCRLCSGVFPVYSPFEFSRPCPNLWGWV